MAAALDPFEILGISPAFDVDLKTCEAKHRELSRVVHPDKFRDGGASERLRATGLAASANEAWRLIRDPVARAEWLFARAGVPVGEANEPKASPDFLMMVLEKREELAEARAEKSRDRVEALKIEMEGLQAESMRTLGEAFRANDANTLRAALPHLGKLRFYRRYLEEVSATEDDFDGLA